MDLSPFQSWDHALAIGVLVDGGKNLPSLNTEGLEPKCTDTRRAAMLQAHHIPHTTLGGVQGIDSHV